MTTFPTLTRRECAEALLELKSPTVLMHVRPDGDTVGSGIALIRILAALGIKAKYICSDPIPQRLRFLFGSEELAESVEGELVTIDVASPLQVGALYEKLPAPTLSIDHHEVNTPFAPNYTVGGESSAGEVLVGVVEELEEMGKLTLTREIAEPLYAAISSDTGRFCYSSTTSQTHIRAARLLDTGVDAARINHLLFNSKSREQIKAEGFVAENMKTRRDGRIAYSTVSLKDRESLGLDIECFESAVDIVRALQGVEITVVLKEVADGKFRASLRSTTHNVAVIAKKFDGGGHALAAGCSPKGNSIEEAAEAVLSELEELF